MTPDQIARYARHLVLKEIGGPGQSKLLAARVAIVGAGGLGGPAGLYLAAAGIGHMTVIDDDVVDTTNLQRQVQFVETDIGGDKATVFGHSLADLNSHAEVHDIKTRLTHDNALELLSDFDVILDGTDSFETRFVINDASLRLGTPLVSGALGRWQGQVALFDPAVDDGPCYRCLVPSIPPDAETCTQVGVVGALAGVIGSMMALETIKHITGAGETLSGKLLTFDGLTMNTRTLTLSRDPACPACGAK